MPFNERTNVHITKQSAIELKASVLSCCCCRWFYCMLSRQWRLKSKFTFTFFWGYSLHSLIWTNFYYDSGSESYPFFTVATQRNKIEYGWFSSYDEKVLWANAIFTAILCARSNLKCLRTKPKSNRIVYRFPFSPHESDQKNPSIHTLTYRKNHADFGQNF